MSRKPKPADERPDDYRQIMHLSLGKPDLVSLDKIVERMSSDPLLGPMKIEGGREKAARYAIAYCAKHGPARITTD